MDISIEDIFNQVIERSFRLSCPKVKIVLAPNYHQEAFKGDGFVEINRTRSFHYRFLVTTDDRSWIQELNPNIPHVGDYRYFQIQMTDTQGRTWLSEAVRPRIDNIFEAYGDKIFSVSGTFQSLLRDLSELDKDADEQYEMIVSNTGRLPWTGWKRSVHTRGDDPHEGYSASACYREIQVEGITVSLEQLENSAHTKCIIKSENRELPPFIDVKVLEALQFITGKFLKQAVQCRLGKHQKILRILSDPESLGTRHPAPISLVDPEKRQGYFDDYWLGFEKMLSYLVREDSENPFFHPIMDAMLSIMEAGSRSNGILALTLSVGVEAILGNCTYISLSKENKIDGSEIEKLKGYLETSVSDTKLRNRVGGLLNSILSNTLSAKDKLVLLVDSEVITADQLKSWETLRHRSAHGNYTKADQLKDFDKLLSDLYTLAHTLVLRETGYDGYITDYGQA